MRNIKLIVGNAKTSIVGDVPQKLIDELLTVPNTTWTKINPKTGGYLKKPIKVTYYICFFEASDIGGSMPTGIAGAVYDWYTDRGVTVDFIDNRKLFNGGDNVVYNWDENIILRQYQKNALSACKEATRGVYVIPTGGGKTIIAKRLIHDLEVKTLYLVPSVELRNQAFSDLSSLTDDISILKAPYDVSNITISTVSLLWSLYKRDYEKFKSVVSQFDLLIGDEIHHVNALAKKKGDKYGGTWVTIFNEIPAYYKFGCTATPGEEKSFSYLSMNIAVGRIIFDVSIQDLTTQNFLSNIEVHFYDVDIKNESFSWLESYNNLIESDKFNDIVVGLARKYNRKEYRYFIYIQRGRRYTLFRCGYYNWWCGGKVCYAKSW